LSLRFEHLHFISHLFSFHSFRVPCALYALCRLSFCDLFFPLPSSLSSPLRSELTLLCRAIQNYSSTSLWVTIIYCLANLCDPLVDLNSRILSAISATQSSGFVGSPADIIVSGHSLGGVGARHFIDDYPQYAAIAFFGTQYNGDDEDLTYGTLGYPLDVASFPHPLLALTGELDLVPFSHAALVYQGMQNNTVSQRLAKATVVVPSMDHSAFCPGFNVSGDIVNELTESQSLAAIGSATGAWIDVLSFDNSTAEYQQAAEQLYQAIQTTEPIITPFLEMRALEEDWCTQAQYLLCTLPTNSPLDITQQTVNGSLQLESAHTSYALQRGGILDITIVSERAYDGGFMPTYVGASEIACKTLSAERINQQLDSTKAQQQTCVSMNKQAIMLATGAFKQSWPISLQRFAEQGREIDLIQDHNSSTGPTWVFEHLAFDESSTDVSVQSIQLFTSLNSLIYPGNYYCKLLSPAKVVEWITTTSLTQRYP
jgi:hypothetical protein